MADDFRVENPNGNFVAQRRIEIVKECLRQEESCLYTSTSLFIWLRRVRLQKQIFVAAPIVLGSLATFSALKSAAPDWIVATLALVASLFPALADALKIQTSVDEIAHLAAEFKALQDRFRRVAKIECLSEIDKAQTALAELMDRMDLARSTSITPPSKFFNLARASIVKGDYTFAVDAPSDEARSIDAPTYADRGLPPRAGA